MQHTTGRVLIKICTLIVLSVFSTISLAQSTTSSIRGKLLDSSGQPVANAEVEVVDQRTGATRRVSSNNTGTFFASNLTVGGPFVVTVDGVKSITIDNISLGDVYNVTIDDVGATDSSGSIEEVVVTAKAAGLSDVASGPSAVFSLDILEKAVAFNRDIKDVFSNDPRINLDDASRGSGVNCGGKNPRFNSISVDGVAQNDRFGLNENGFAAANGQPFPFDAIAQISVELAPFDATAGGFSACSINSVTKSGANEFFGNVFYEFGSDSLRGDNVQVEGRRVNIGNEDFDSFKAGFTLGGPIIQDKLFFFAAYEKAEDPEFTAQGFAGSNNGIQRDFLSEADFNRIRNIAQDVYGYDPGGEPGNGTNDQDKILARIDWDINDSHRATFVYNKYEGEQLRASDNDLDEFEFSNHFYNKGTDLETTIFKLNSQWTDNFSSEIFISRNEVDDFQETVGDRDFGDFQISIGRDVVYLGADDSRQANDLVYSSDLVKLNLQYLVGNHVITGGFEYDQLDVFNLFVQHSRGGEYDFFDDSGRGGLSGIDKFELGLPNRIFYGSGGGTNNPLDAGANFEPSKTSLYIQDEYFFDNLDLTLVAGLRYERFGEDARPAFNAAFAAANGIRNDANIDGVDIWQPRIGFTWNKNDKTTIRGGLGIFSGGNPNVWISNSFSNDGITNVQERESFSQSIFDLPLTGQGRPGFDVPQQLVDQVIATTAADASTRRLVLVDPDYEQPSELKIALGTTYDLSDRTRLDADVLYTKQRDSAIYFDLAQQVVGQTVAGSPILASTNGSQNYILTNSDRDADSLVVSFGVQHQFDNGIDLTVGYAYSDAEDITGMNSSVAFSNFVNSANNNPNDLRAGTSEYNTPNRVTLRLNYERELFAGLTTNISLYGQLKDGQASSFTMSSDGLESDGFLARQLLYVPTANDAAVVYGGGFDRAAFDQFIADRGLGRGQFVSRNSFDSRFSQRFDLRIDQELPEISGFKPRVFLKINNVLNLINSDWGEQFDAPFVRSQVVESSVNGAGQLVFEEFSNPQSSELLNDSVWQARIGVEVSF